jgi:hypothetical protein
MDTTDPSPSVTPQLRQLLEDAVNSFEKLEVVRRLWRKHEVSWSLDRLSDEIVVPRDRLALVLAELQDQGVVIAGPARGEYRASTRGPRADLIEAMIALFERDPLAILPIINELALERIRGMAARTFADAFVLKRPSKKEPGDG